MLRRTLSSSDINDSQVAPPPLRGALMSQTQAAQNQHYVPKFILRNFLSNVKKRAGPCILKEYRQRLYHLNKEHHGREAFSRV